jgi:bacteriocin-like protein
MDNEKTMNLNELVSVEDFSTLNMNELMRIEGGADTVLICEGTTMCSGGGGVTCINAPSISCSGASVV